MVTSLDELYACVSEDAAIDNEYEDSVLRDAIDSFLEMLHEDCAQYFYKALLVL